MSMSMNPAHQPGGPIDNPPAATVQPVSQPQPTFAAQKRRRGEPLQAGDPVTLADLMDDHIIRRLEQLDTLMAVAAELGICARTLRRRIDRRKLTYRKFPRRTQPH